MAGVSASDSGELRESALPSFTVVTVALNDAGVLERTLESVKAQSHLAIEHILVDGGSTDGTAELARAHRRPGFRFLSEPDRGIYHAMNKGLRLATGDVVGFLNAGDFYPDPDVIATVAEVFSRDWPDVVFGDLIYFDPRNVNRIKRYYAASGFKRSDLRRGLMPPHPATFVTRRMMLEVDGFDESYRIAADFDCMVKLFWERYAECRHVPRVIVHMEGGGISNASLKNRWIVAREFRESCRRHAVPTGWLRLFSRYPGKLWQSARRGINLRR